MNAIAEQYNPFEKTKYIKFEFRDQISVLVTVFIVELERI